MRLTLTEGSAYDVDFLVRNESSWPYNWLSQILEKSRRRAKFWRSHVQEQHFEEITYKCDILGKSRTSYTFEDRWQLLSVLWFIFSIFYPLSIIIFWVTNKCRYTRIHLHLVIWFNNEFEIIDHLFFMIRSQVVVVLGSDPIWIDICSEIWYWFTISTLDSLMRHL